MSATLPPAGTDGLAMPARAIAVLAITLSAVLGVLDGSMLNVALPRLAEELGISAAQSVWIVNAYQLATVVCLLPMGVLADRLGYARVFGAGGLLYLLAALACAHAEGFGSLLAGRILQGLGSAGVMGCSSALLRATWPQRLFGTGVGLNTTAVTFAAAAGPSVGALILTLSGDWRWLFLAELPAGALACLCALALPALPRRPRRVRPASLLLNLVALGAGVIGLGLLVRQPLAGIALLALTALAWWLWVRVDRAEATPLLPLDLFAIARFRWSIAASVSMFGAQAASLVALPFFLHEVWGRDVIATGLLLTAWPVCATATSSVAIRLARRFTVAELCATGAGLSMLGLAWVCLLPTHWAGGWLVPGLMLGGVGVGLFQAPNMHEILSSSPRSRSGAAGSVQAIARVGGAALGAALAGLCFALPVGRAAPTVALAAAALVALAALLINLLRRPLVTVRQQ